MNRISSEQELARQVVAWLQAQHWEVYQEVSTGLLGARADIVALQGKVSWIIETKMSLSLGLLAQVSDWLGWANFVSVAVPSSQNRSRGRAYAVRLLRRQGIGIIEVSDGRLDHDAPRKFRRIARPIAELLCDAHKTMAKAGSARGGYATPFALTCRAVRQFVANHPGCTMGELIEDIDHHYLCDATARSCLNRWIGTSKIPDVERRHVDSRWRLYWVGKKEAPWP